MVCGPDDMRVIVLQRLSEAVVKLKRDDGFWELVEIPTENVCGIVHRVARPVQALAISVGRVELCLELFDALLGATKAEYSFDVGRYKSVS